MRLRPEYGAILLPIVLLGKSLELHGAELKLLPQALLSFGGSLSFFFARPVYPLLDCVEHALLGLPYLLFSLFHFNVSRYTEEGTQVLQTPLLCPP